MAYVAANDLLSLQLVAAFGMLIVEGLIPGFVSAHLPLSYVGIAVLALVAAIQFLGKKIGISHDVTEKKHAFILPLLLTLSFLLIGNSMLKYPLWQNMLITLGALSVSYIIFTLFTIPVRK